VCDFHEESLEEILSKKRIQNLVEVRQLYSYLAKTHALEFTFGEIGNVLNKDHSSIVHSVNAIKNRMVISNDYVHKVGVLEEAFKQQFEQKKHKGKVEPSIFLEKSAQLRERIAKLEAELTELRNEQEADKKELKFLRDYYKINYKNY
jgi:hypothetical protein